MELSSGEATLGRSRSCTVTLRDPAASRNHVLLIVEPGQLRARDLQSSNGTFLNGERLTGERRLADGDCITIGETEIVVHVQPPTDDVGSTVRLDAARLQCPSCGAELPLHAGFCSHCGYRLSADAVAEREPAPLPAPARPPLPPAVPPPPPTPMAPPAAENDLYRAAHPVVPHPMVPPAAASRPPAERTVIEPSPGAELLPPIGEEVVRTPAPRPALPPTPPPGSLRAPVPPAPPGAPAGVAARPGAPPRPAAPVVAPRGAPPAAAVASQPLVVPSGLGYRPAGFWIRAAAQLVDAVWMVPVIVGPSLLVGGPTSANGTLVMVVMALLVYLGVPVLGWGLFGATPGKLVLGLRVIAGGRRKGIGVGRALLRLCGTMTSSILGIGYLMVAFSRDKRALHDHLAGTAVMRR